VLGTFHNDPTYDLENKRSGLGHRALEHLSNHCLHRCIAVSGETGRIWCQRTRLSTSRVATIHNGINPEQFQRQLSAPAARTQLGVPPEALLLGCVGRLHPDKGFGYLLDAVAMLAGAYPTLHVAFAGQGVARDQLTAQADRLGIADRIHLVGFRRDVQTLYDAADIFVLSSVCEALPYVVLEAMATGLPVVGTKVGGVPEVIQHDRTGYLVPARQPAALADALRRLLDSAALREQFGRAGRQRVFDEFTEEQMTGRTIQLYREMIGAGRMSPIDSEPTPTLG
jgi:glycosyltransferase involved in cell wall biosynthesis